MTTKPSTPDKPEKHRKVLALTIVVLLSVFVSCLGITFPFDVLFQLVAGCFFYINRTLPTLTISVEHTLWFLSTLILFTVGLHFVCRKLALRADNTLSNWQKRWSLSLVAMLLLLAMGGICVISITHQAWWMAMGNDRMIVYHHRMMAARRSQSKHNLKQIGLGMHLYHDDFHQFPMGGTFSSGEPHHSWVTRLLPYFEQTSLYNKIDLHQPWTAESNREPFQSDLYMFKNPGMTMDYDNGQSSAEAFQGYQPSHYAANSRVLNVNSTMNLKEITDGITNTILAGEIKSHIKPWGDPANFRDPALGINQNKQGFGGPFKGGSQFLLGDGSVRFISEDIDPAILKALSTPNSGEPVDDF